VDENPPFNPNPVETNKLFITLLLLLAPLVILLVSLFIGRYPKPLFMPFSVLLNDQLGQNLVINLRLPRLITSALLGMSLATAGGVMQMLFRNPLVEPGFMG